MARDDLIGDRTGKLSSAFGHYVRVYDERVPFTGEQLAAHRECRSWLPFPGRPLSPQEGSRSTYRDTLLPKNEALSLLGAGHSHALRVRLLLEMARQACQPQQFTPIDGEPLSLDVVLRCPTGQNPVDATDYLGGIADVLEEMSHRGPLEHLGALAAVRLYRNDRQIKQVIYREDESAQVSYTVTVRPLSSL